MRSVLILGLATVLLVGCGGAPSQVTAVEKCIHDQSVFENFPLSASSFDKSKAEALARASCDPVVTNDDSLKKLAVHQFEKKFPNQNKYKILDIEIVRNNDDGYDIVFVKFFEKEDPEQTKMLFDASLSGYTLKWKTGHGVAYDQD